MRISHEGVDQVAESFATDIALVSGPDGPGPLCEVPIVPLLPKELNSIP